MNYQINPGTLKNRILENAEIDQRHLLRPLLLYRGGMSEGRLRSLLNLTVGLMDANVASVCEAVKVSTIEDFRHICGIHSNPNNGVFNSILSRLVYTPKVHDLIPGLREYALELGNSQGGFIYRPYSISEYGRSRRSWRIKWPDLPEVYPYISGTPTSEHEMLLAVDSIVPKGLPNSVRCDVCQDMIVALLSGEATIENLSGDLPKYMRKFWQMFPTKYGHISLDQPIGRTDDMSWNDSLLNAKHSRLIYSGDA